MDGKKFEALIKKSCEMQGLSYTRLKDAGWQGEETTRRFTSRNLCDCIIFDGKTLLFAEAKHRKKSVDAKGLTQLQDLLDKDAKTDIKNQVCGFLFCIDEQFYFGTVARISDMFQILGKKSFNLKDAELHLKKIATYLPPRARVPRLDMADLFKSKIREMDK